MAGRLLHTWQSTQLQFENVVSELRERLWIYSRMLLSSAVRSECTPLTETGSLAKKAAALHKHLWAAPVYSLEFTVSIVINCKVITPPGIVLNCWTPAIITVNPHCDAEICNPTAEKAGLKILGWVTGGRRSFWQIVMRRGDLVAFGIPLQR